VLVIIAGGHGKIGMLLARILREHGHEVRSLIRKSEQIPDIEELGAQPIVCDLEAATEKQVAQQIGSGDAIVFAAGAGPGSGPERKWTMDHGGAVKLISAAKRNGIDRYVMVSAIGADPQHEGDDTFAVYLRAKGQADADLQASGLDFTVVRPSRLTDDSGTGRVRIASSVGGGEIPRADVAEVLAELLDRNAGIGLTLELTSGDTPIDEAIEAL
jgi:nucleoside-diphosphate-sugar epimerase